MDERTIHTRHAPHIGRGETRQQDLLEEFIEEQENEKLFPSTQRNMIPLQLAIGYYYRFVLHVPEPYDWGGRDGAISNVIKSFNLVRGAHMRNRIKRVFNSVNLCLQKGIHFDG